MSRNIVEVKTILYDYYWSKKEVKSILWKKERIFI